MSIIQFEKMRCVSPIVIQIWVVFTILIMMVGHGMVMGITSSMIPALQAPDSSIKVDLEQVSWLTASVGMGSLVVTFGTTSFLAIYGRRGAIFIGLMPAITGSLICYYCYDVNILIFGRFLSGLGVGAGIMGAVTIGEFATPKYRGVFLNLKSAALYIGTTIVHTLGNYFHWRTITITITILYTVTFVMTYTWPESPAWLASQKRYDECTKYFYLLRGKSEQSTRELVAMIKVQEERPLEVDTTALNDVKQFLKKFTKRNFLKPLLVYFFVSILLEMSGRHVFPAYALNIIYKLDSNKANAFYYTLGIDLLMCTSAVLSSGLVKVMKRRTLLFWSGASSVVLLLAVCLYYYLQSMSLVSTKYNAVSILLFGLNFGAINLGCTPICLTLIGEIFPLEHRPTGVSVGCLFISFFMILTLKVTPNMIETIKMYGTFAVYGVCMGFCMIILYFILPETKDKTLQEIEDYFNPHPKQNGQNVEEQTGFISNHKGQTIPPFWLS